MSRPRPWRVVFDTARCWALIVLAWVFVAVSPSWWRVLIAVPVIGTQFYGLFILGHDAMHRRLFRNRIDNDNYADLLIYGPIGVITRINNKNHLKHHHELATSSDPDRHKHACVNKADPLETVAYLTGVRSTCTHWPTCTAVVRPARRRRRRERRCRLPRTVTRPGTWRS